MHQITHEEALDILEHIYQMLDRGFQEQAKAYILGYLHSKDRMTNVPPPEH